MKRKTKIMLIALALVLVSLASVTAVYAYLSDKGTKENKFTVGNNSVEIEEDFTPPPEMHQGDNRFLKKVRVANTGNVPCYVRVFFDFSDSEVKDHAKISGSEATKGNLDSLDWYSYAEYVEKHLPEGWVYIPVSEDSLLGGYFYYTKPLPVGGKTPYLFQAVNAIFEFETDVTDFEIIITTDSIQLTDKDGKEFEEPNAYQKAWTEFLQ